MGQTDDDQTDAQVGQSNGGGQLRLRIEEQLLVDGAVFGLEEGDDACEMRMLVMHESLMV